MHRHHSPLLAGVNKNGTAWANPKIKTQLGVTHFKAVLTHEKTFVRESAKPNVSWSLAVKRATKAERKLFPTLKLWRRHNSKLGALERKLKREAARR